MKGNSTREAIMNLNRRKDIGSINFREVDMIGKVDPHTTATKINPLKATFLSIGLKHP